MTEISTIPVLPAASMPTTLAFYQALGFAVTYHQTKPNVYAATQRGELHLHFAEIKGLDPAKVYATCLVLVPEVEQLHQTFAGALRTAYGRVPASGIPRISRMKPGQSRFTIVDVAGSSLIFIRRDAPGETSEPAPSGSRLDKALRAAAKLRDSKNDDNAAAQLLDAVLRRPEPGAAVERARVLIARAEIAIAQDDTARTRAVYAELDALPLTEDERRQLAPDLAAVDAITTLVRPAR